MPDVPITVTVEVPEHPKWVSQTVERLPETGLGPKHLDALVLRVLQEARDRKLRDG